MASRTLRLIVIFGWLLVLLRLMNSVFLRVNLAGFPGADSITAFSQLLASLLSTRELAWAVLMGFALWRREWRLAGFMFVMRAMIDSLDVMSGALDILQSRAPATLWGQLGFTLILTVLTVLAARRLLGSNVASVPRSQVT